MKKNKSTKHWLLENNKEIFFNKSKQHGYRSRSAFKLIEMNDKFKFLRKNSYLLDLGSSPGGWSQVASKKIIIGKILAVDIKNMQNIKGVNFINGDFEERKTQNIIVSYFKNKIDVVLSDMAANTSGNKELDSFRTGELCIKAMELAKKMLNDNGIFISKIFMGSIFKEINETAKKTFKKVVIYKPLSSKKESKEIYIYCKGVLKNDK